MTTVFIVSLVQLSALTGPHCRPKVPDPSEALEKHGLPRSTCESEQVPMMRVHVFKPQSILGGRATSTSADEMDPTKGGL